MNVLFPVSHIFTGLTQLLYQSFKNMHCYAIKVSLSSLLHLDSSLLSMQSYAPSQTTHEKAVWLGRLPLHFCQTLEKGVHEGLFGENIEVLMTTHPEKSEIQVQLLNCSSSAQTGLSHMERYHPTLLLELNDSVMALGQDVVMILIVNLEETAQNIRGSLV